MSGFTISDSTAITCTAADTLSAALPTCTGMKSIHSWSIKVRRMSLLNKHNNVNKIGDWYVTYK